MHYEVLFIVGAICGFYIGGFAQSEVSVTSNLIDGNIAYDNQTWIFRCITEGTSMTLTWTSDDYIGSGGDVLQFKSVHSPGRTASNSINPTTIATLINATTVNGVTVIKSELCIIASVQYSMSSVECRANIHGTPTTILFQTILDLDVILTSNLNKEDTAYDMQTAIFRCTIRGTGTSLTWSSDDYIGSGDNALRLSSNDIPGQIVSSSRNPNTTATLISTTTNNGMTMIISELQIITSEQYQYSFVSCHGQVNKNVTTSSIMFRVKPPDVLLTSNLAEGDTAYNTQPVTFRCIIQGTSTNLIWISDEYIGSNGDVLQFASIDPPGVTGTISAKPTTIATLINASTDSDTRVTVIESKLRISASSQYPNSTVTCRVNGYEALNVSRFRVIQSSVSLTNNLNEVNIAYEAQTVTFRCIIQGTGTILTWISDDYIGSGGVVLQFASLHSPGWNASNSLNPTTVATLISANTVNGVTVIESELRIIASVQYPTSSVSCRVDNYGELNTAMFRVAQSGVSLISNLNEGDIAYDAQIVVFRCTIRSTHTILTWSSDDYIGPGGNVLESSSIHRPGQNASNSTYRTTIATLINATTDTDTRVTVIESELRIIASLRYPTSSVSCRVNGHGEPSTTMFHVTPSIVSVTSNLADGNIAYDNQTYIFRCTIRGTGKNLTWSSDEYIGGDVLEFTAISIRGLSEPSSTHPTTIATLINASTDTETGVIIIESELRIRASSQYPNSSVSCRINSDGAGATNTTTFQTISKICTETESSCGDDTDTSPEDTGLNDWAVNFGVSVAVIVAVIFIIATAIIKKNCYSKDNQTTKCTHNQALLPTCIRTCPGLKSLGTATT